MSIWSFSWIYVGGDTYIFRRVHEGVTGVARYFLEPVRVKYPAIHNVIFSETDRFLEWHSTK